MCGVIFLFVLLFFFVVFFGTIGPHHFLFVMWYNSRSLPEKSAIMIHLIRIARNRHCKFLRNPQNIRLMFPERGFF